MPSRCEARGQSDQMRCERCDLTWDTNDPDPPECPLETPPPLPDSIVDRIIGARQRIAAGAKMIDVNIMEIFNLGREYERELVATKNTPDEPG